MAAAGQVPRPKQHGGEPVSTVVFHYADCRVLRVSQEGSVGCFIELLPVQVLQSHIGQPVNAQVSHKTDSYAAVFLDAELESGHIETVHGMLYADRQSLADIKVCSPRPAADVLCLQIQRCRAGTGHAASGNVH